MLFRSLLVALVALTLAAFMTVGLAQDKKDAPAEKAPEVKKDEPKAEDKKDVKTEPAKDVKTEPKTEDKTEPKTEAKTETKEPAKTETGGLAWRFEKDKPFYQKMTTSTEQNIKVMGLDVTQKQDQTFYFKWTPLSEKDGVWEIKQEIEAIIMKIDIAGNPVSFDSTQENPAGGANTALSEFFKALRESSFKLFYNTKTKKVEKVEGREEFLKKLSSANQSLQPLLNKILSEEALKQMADPTFGFLPPTPKKVDDSWESNSKLDLGPIGSYAVKYKFTLKGEDKANKDLDLIQVDTMISYAAPSEPDPTLPFKIKASTLSTKDKQEPGKILFNTKLGRLDSWDSKLVLGGNLTIEIGGNTTQVELSQTQTINLKVDDKSLKPTPEAKKGP